MKRYEVELVQNVYNWSHHGGYLYIMAENEAEAMAIANKIVDERPDDCKKAKKAVELTEQTEVDKYFDGVAK
jgi:hypothetical protein